MNSDSGGTLTAIFMLIPLVAVPYFAIRGTQDLPDSIPSLNDTLGPDGTTDTGEGIPFASTVGFERTTAEDSLGAMDDAAPFPSDESTIVTNPSSSLGGGGGFSDPFATGDESVPPISPPASLSATPAADDSFEAMERELQQHRAGLNTGSGLGAAQVSRGVPKSVGSGSRNLQASSISHSQPAPPPATTTPAAPSSGVTAKWNAMVGQLKTVGMRNYRVESTADRSVYYVTAFFPDGVTIRRFEGEGKHPLHALASVVDQVNEWRVQAGQ